MGFIIDVYNDRIKWHRAHKRHTFQINEQVYAIFEAREMPFSMEEPYEHHIYDTLDAALQFAQQMRHINS